jgi:predicted dinucleotide-binding enzyme
MTKIGVLGSGVAGKALATGFLKHGYEVKIGTSDVNKLKEWKAGPGAKGSIGSFSEAAGYGEIVVLAVKGTAALEAVEKAGPGNLSGKTVIDVTNPIADAPPVNGVLQYFTSINDSLMERLQKAFPGIHFVKAFGMVGSPFMVDPQFPGGKPTMFICGNNDNSKSAVNNILVEFGWEVDDLGKVEAARAIEPLCMLWCIPGFLRNQWTHAFKLLKL